MGVRAWRASSAREASDLIGAMRVHVAVVDLRLPLDRRADEPTPGACGVEDEAGPRILELLSRLETPPPTLVIKRGRSSREDTREMTQALSMGAFAAIDRPVDLERMLDAMRRLLARHYAGRWPDDAGPGRAAARHPHAPPGVG
ncbi:MAG: response regulator [Phycisphaerales bacterium]|nr:MAG: response regulator [Phycisphaerales bacterium]